MSIAYGGRVRRTLTISNCRSKEGGEINFMEKVYLLKDLAQLSGLSIDTIKYYLKLGLIKEVERSPSTNFRYFDDSTLKRLSQIREMRKSNMSLNQIKETLSAAKR
jgi:hypothetical protein